MTKPEKKKKARVYRKEGKSMIWIAEQLDVARSSVSLWTRDIELTDEQEEYLQKSNERREAQKKGAEANVIKHRKKRMQYQEEGRIKAREGDPLHLAGCMLYWAEGEKSRYTLAFVNSDAEMMIYYMQFLRHSLHIEDKKIKIRINAYIGNDLSEDEIIQYWLGALELTEDNLNKSSFNKQPSSSNQRGRKLPYGVCEVSVHSTRLTQHVYGAIQEYTGMDKPYWLDMP